MHCMAICVNVAVRVCVAVGVRMAVHLWWCVCVARHRMHHHPIRQAHNQGVLLSVPHTLSTAHLRRNEKDYKHASLGNHVGRSMLIK